MYTFEQGQLYKQQEQSINCTEKPGLLAKEYV